MTKPTDIVRRYIKAFDQRDMATARTLVHDGFTFTGAIMTANGADEFFAMVAKMPDGTKTITRRMLADGDNVVHEFFFELPGPADISVPMCEIFDVDGDRIAACNLYFDTAKFPQADAAE